MSDRPDSNFVSFDRSESSRSRVTGQVAKLASLRDSESKVELSDVETGVEGKAKCKRLSGRLSFKSQILALVAKKAILFLVLKL